MMAIDWAAVGRARDRLVVIGREHPELTGPPSPENAEGWVEELEDPIMGRPLAHGEPTVQVAFRLPESLVERLDAFVQEQKQVMPGMRFSRADAVRVLLLRALDDSTPKGKRTKR